MDNRNVQLDETKRIVKLKCLTANHEHPNTAWSIEALGEVLGDLDLALIAFGFLAGNVTLDEAAEKLGGNTELKDDAGPELTAFGAGMIMHFIPHDISSHEVILVGLSVSSIHAKRGGFLEGEDWKDQPPDGRTYVAPEDLAGALVD